MISTCIAITNRCNLKCNYCFEKSSDSKLNLLSDDISIDTCIKALEFYLKNRDKKDFISVVWFGGEPLLNYKIIIEGMNFLRKYISKLKNKINIETDFWVITNGTIWNNEIEQMFIDNPDLNVIVSWDGTTHDKYRCNTKFLVEENIDKLNRLGNLKQLNYQINPESICNFLNDIDFF